MKGRFVGYTEAEVVAQRGEGNAESTMLKQIFTLIKQTALEWAEDKATRLAAALAYYTVFSIPPLLLIVVTVTGLFVDRETVQGQVVDQLNSILGEGGSEVFDAMFNYAAEFSGGGIATLIGAVALFFGATAVFAQLHEAMNTVWGVTPEEGGDIWHLVKKRFFSFTLVVGVAFMLLVSLVVSAGLAALDEYARGVVPEAENLLQWLNFVASLALTIFLFAATLKVVPDALVRWNDVWVGATITGVLFTIGKWALGEFLATTATVASYGAAGSIVLLMLWVYYSTNIFFFGAEFTKVWARRHGTPIRPDEDAERLTAEERAEQGMEPVHAYEEEEG